MRVRLIPVAAAVVLGALPSAAAAAERGERVPVQRSRVSGPAKRPQTPRAVRLHPTNPRALAAIKRRLDRRRGLLAAGPFSASPKLAVFSGLNKGGLSAGESGSFTPPDTTGSIGPSHYVEMVNDAVAVFRRSDLSRVTGSPPPSLETFMQPPSGTVISDPQIQWDQRSGRWYYLATAFVEDMFGNVTGPNYLVFGFSKTSDPSNLSASAWCHYNIPSGGSSGSFQLDDYPKLGHDDLHLIFGSNVFAENSADLVTARIVSVPKPPGGSLSSCPAIGAATRFPASGTLRTADGNMAATPVPANTANASSAGYVAAADDPTESGNEGPKNQLMVWHVGGSATSPVLAGDGNINVSTYDVPPSAFEGAGVVPELDTLDGRLTMAVAQRDPTTGREAVWTQHTINTGSSDTPEPGMRWYELLPSTLTRAQQGTISDPDPNVDDYNGALSPGANGELTVFNYNQSSLTTTPQIRARARGSALSPGASTGELLLGTSNAPASDGSCVEGGGVCRWGDYSGASPDQSNPYVVWGSNQAVGPPSGPDPAWTTRNFALGDSPPKADFSPATTRPQADFPTRFTSTASDPDGQIVAVQWDLNGDGNFGDASGAVIQPVFHVLGQRTIAMRAVDDIGLAAVARHTIRVVDTIRPRLRVAARRHQRKRRVLRHRLPFRVRASEPVRVSARLVVGRRTAIRLGLLSRRSHRRRVTIGTRSFRVRLAHRTKRVRLKLRRRARRAIRRRRGNVVMQLRVRGRDRAGNRSRLYKRRVVLIR